MIKMKRPFSTSYNRGITLVELLVALMVTSIVLTAVATLAFALSSAYDASDNTSQKQSQVRFATLRVSDLIRNCKMVCATTGDDIAIWKADNDPENGLIDVTEVAYIQKGSSNDYLKIIEFEECPDLLKWWFRGMPEQVYLLGDIWFRDLFISQCETIYAPVLPQCGNVQFDFDVPPPWSRFVSITFDLDENSIVNRYQIGAGLRCYAENLLDQTGESLVSDDD